MASGYESARAKLFRSGSWLFLHFCENHFYMYFRFWVLMWLLEPGTAQVNKSTYSTIGIPTVHIEKKPNARPNLEVPVFVPILKELRKARVWYWSSSCKLRLWFWMFHTFPLRELRESEAKICHLATVLFKGAQAWEFWPCVFYTRKSCLGVPKWLGDWSKNGFFINIF